MDDPSAEICSVQKQKSSSFASSLDVQYKQQAQLLSYGGGGRGGVMSDDSTLQPESGKLLHLACRDVLGVQTAVWTKFLSRLAIQMRRKWLLLPVVHIE